MSPEQATTGVATCALAGEPATDLAPAGSAIAAREEPKASIPTCDNCGAEVPDKFCGRCGQRREHALHSVWHFSREVTEDMTHADSRLWSTILALLFKPGFLTREFIAGRRMRYLPPLRLYLVLSVAFFLVLGTHHQDKAVVLTPSRTGSGLEVKPADQVDDLAARPGETTEQRAARLCDPHYDGPFAGFVTPFLKKGCTKYVEDKGRSAAEAFIHTLPRAMFVFLPLLALVMKPLYWRPNRYYVEHLLFFLHNHAFGFLVFALLMLVTRFAPSSIGNWATFLVWLYLPYYLFVSMRRVYGQSRWLTFAKLTVLSFAYFIGGVVTLALTGVYSVYSG
jgi:hypothetical protein